MSAIQRGLPFAVLILEALLFWRHVLFSERWSIPWDLRGYHLPLAAYFSAAVSRWELPLWNPYTYCGFPFYANLQAQVFYPPAWLVASLANWTGAARLLDLLEWQVAAHAAAGGIFAYLLLRKLGAGAASATLGATVFQLGPYFASQAQHLGAISAGAWLPLAWLSVLHLNERASWRWRGLLALSLALAFLSGFPAAAIAVYASTTLVGIALIGLRRARPRLALELLGGAAWSFLLAAVQLLPSLELTSLSTARYRGQWGDGAGVPWQALISLVWPNYYNLFDLNQYRLPWNPTFLYLFCSITGAGLAAAAAVFRRGRHWAAFGLVTLLSLLGMLGSAAPLIGRLYRAMPVWALSPVYPEFAMLPFTLGVAVLAGLGAEHLLRPRAGFLPWVAAAVAALELLAAGSGRPMNRGPKGPPATPEMFQGSAEALRTMRGLVEESKPAWRIEVTRGEKEWITAAPLLRTPTANGDEPLALERVLRVRRLFAEGEPWGRYYEPARWDSPALGLLGVRYALTRGPDAGLAESKGWKLRTRLGPDLVYENTSALPRFFLPEQVRPVRSLDEALAAMSEPEFDGRLLALVEGVGKLPARLGRGSVEVRSYAANRIELKTRADQPAFLATSEVYYPGWRAYVDGARQPLLLTNGAFRGMLLPAGEHTVRMEFTPDILRYSAALTLAAVLLLIVALCFGDNKRERGSWISSST